MKHGRASLPADHIAWLRGLVPDAIGRATISSCMPASGPVSLWRTKSKDDLSDDPPAFPVHRTGFRRGRGAWACWRVVGLHQPNRIGLDTGAGMGGTLTCAVLEDDLVGLLAT